MKVILAMLGVSACFVVSALATPINITNGGLLGIGGLTVEVIGTSGSGCINFYNASSPDACDATGNDTFLEGPAIDTNIFTNLATGHIKDIPGPNSLETAFITAPGPGGLVSFDFLDLQPTGSNFCTATTDSGPLPAACALAGSPFNFTINSPTNITVSFTADLCGYTGASGGVNCANGTPYTGLFQTTFNSTFQDANGAQHAVSLANLVADEPTLGILNQVSASLAPLTTAPEPGTIALFGLGLIGFGTAKLGRRRA